MVANISFYKRIYLALNLVLLGIPLYKMLTMGLLPVAPSDYIALVPQFSVSNT